MAERRPYMRGSKRQYACETCGTKREQWPSQAKKRFFCSHPCYAKSMRGMPGRPQPLKERPIKPCLQCGSAINATPSVIARRKYCSRSCQGLALSGVNAHNWRGGSSRRRSEQGRSSDYKRFRVRVLTRDGGSCRWCDSEGTRAYRRLEVHHIIPVGVRPDLTLDDGNAISLCRKHHDRTRSREHEYAGMFAALIGEPLRMLPVCNRAEKMPLNVSREELHRLYVVERMSSNKIGATLSVSGACILKHLRRHGIPVRPPPGTQGPFI